MQLGIPKQPRYEADLMLSEKKLKLTPKKYNPSDGNMQISAKRSQMETFEGWNVARWKHTAGQKPAKFSVFFSKLFWIRKKDSPHGLF